MGAFVVWDARWRPLHAFGSERQARAACDAERAGTHYSWEPQVRPGVCAPSEESPAPVLALWSPTRR